VLDKIQVIAHIHPFLPTDRIIKDYDAGSTVQAIISDLVQLPTGRVIVAIDGELITDYSVMPQPGANMIIRVVPAGSGGGAQTNDAKSGAWTGAGGLAIMALATLSGNLGLWLVGAGIFVDGVKQIINSNAASDDIASAPRSEQLPSIRGGRNRSNPWGKIPVVFGTHLIQPFYAARPYTSIDGPGGVDMFLHVLMVVSNHARTGGNVLVSNIKIGETILATNAANQVNGAITVDGPFTADIQVYNNGTSPSLYPEIVLEDAPGIELDSDVSGDNYWRSTSPGVTKVSIDVTLPRGLYKYNDKGVKQAHTVTITIKRRVTGSGQSWAAASTVHTFTFATDSVKTIRYNYTETVSAGQYDYAVTRSANDPSDFKGTSLTQWSAFRSIKNGVRVIDATVQAGLCVLAIKIKATADLQGTVDQINCIAKQSVPIFSGGNWNTFAYSENPAALFLAALRGPANPRPVPNAAIDWTRLQDWYTTCATKSWTCNLVISNGMRLRDMLSMIAKTGRANITLRDGLYSVVVDESKSTFIQHFVARNVRNFSWQKAFIDRPHAIKFNFVNAADGYAVNERIVYNDGYTIANATQFQQVQLPGLTDPDLVQKHGRYLLAIQKLRPAVYSFETDAEGIIAEPGDLVRISHDAIAVGLISARIKSVQMSGVNATGITIDELVRFETGKSYAVRIRRSSDNSSVYAPLSNAAGTESNMLTFTMSTASVPAIGDLVIFGEATIETLEAIIVGIESGDDLGCRLYVADRADAVHSVDSEVIPAYQSNVSRPPQIGASTAPPTVISTAVERVVREVFQAETTDGIFNPIQTQELIVIISPRYLGRYDSAHPATPNDGDWWVVYDTDDDPIQRGIWWSNGGTPERITNASSMALQAKMVEALTDVAWAESNDYGVSGDYGIENFFQSLSAVTAFIQNLFAQQITVPDGGRIRYETGQGVQKRTVQLADEKIDWIDIPDTSPATPEQLRARIGRLGVGDAILMDGDFGAQIKTLWKAPSDITANQNVTPSLIQLSTGELRVAYSEVNGNYTVERIWNGTSWGAESYISTVGSVSPNYVELDSGELRVTYAKLFLPSYSPPDLIVERIWNGASWGAESVVSDPSIRSNSPSYIKSNTGELRIIYLKGALGSAILVERIWNGTSWGAESIINNNFCSTPKGIYLSSGELRVAYRRDSGGSLVERIWNGTNWSAEFVINNASSITPSYIQLNTGELRIIYMRISDFNIVERIWNGTSWDAESVISSTFSQGPSCIQLNTGELYLVYVDASTYLIKERTLQRYARLGAGITTVDQDATNRWIDFEGIVRLRWPLAGGTVTAINL
jgi:hypothetical protein